MCKSASWISTKLVTHFTPYIKRRHAHTTATFLLQNTVVEPIITKHHLDQPLKSYLYTKRQINRISL